ncbi:hypothetical protein TWF730_005875 [Orbilia blumenaviensis]|uniref:Uncharacterized protein n=1 Tax=Orbilia blumenaviensis TaxID=1796055 RepID=A0AAV9VJW5_9PEZI
MDTATNTQTSNNDSIAPLTGNQSVSKQSFLRRVSDKVLIPIVAVGLSTPIISQGICLVGSKILKHKMERETELMMARNRVRNGSNGINGDSIALSKEEKEMRKAEMSAMKEHFKRRKAEAKKERQLLKAEKAALRKNRSILTSKLQKKATPPSIVATANQEPTAIANGPNPPTYSEAISRFDNTLPGWGKSGPSVLLPHPPGVPVTYINLSPATGSSPTKCKGPLGWIKDKKDTIWQKCKLAERTVSFKAKVKATKKVGLIFGIGHWGNY